MIPKPILVGALVLAFAAGSALAADNPTRRTILDSFAAEAKQADPGFTGFSAERGAAFFAATQSGGGAETPSCTTCHGANPIARGQTRAGKPIEPMAVSAAPDRFTDPEKVAKWFERNCASVLGRACTAQEKGDFITFMATK
ncbi:MAG TPA: DUF1924 domain-containing protein [Azospirillaceae bacterium]|nr:DUF1924 domain-containing protein [Azospirillaceae bacterium]